MQLPFVSPGTESRGCIGAGRAVLMQSRGGQMQKVVQPAGFAGCP